MTGWPESMAYSRELRAVADAAAFNRHGGYSGNLTRSYIPFTM